MNFEPHNDPLNYREALIFGRYLTGKKISEHVCDLYCKALEIHHLSTSGRDKKHENFILRFPIWIGCMDAALALTNRQSVLRKKILVMLSVLETIPEYSDYFLAEKYSKVSLVKLVLVGIRSIYRFLIGFIIIKLFCAL